MVLGHDDQVLADPDIGVVSPVSEAYVTTGTRLGLRWTDAAKGRRLDLSGEAAGTVYGSGIQGDDVDLRLISAFRCRLSSRFAMDASMSGWRFRRGEVSVFDFDLVRGSLRMAWAPHSSWLLASGYRHNEVGFRERFLLDEPDRRENQHQNDVFVGLVRNLGTRSFLGTEFTYRRTVSNEPRSEYSGPLAVVRAGIGLPGNFNLTAQAVYAHRNYDAALALLATGEVFVDTLGLRRDDTWQFGLTLERELSPQVSVFLDGNLVRQESNDAFVGFDQARVSLGIQMDLLAPPGPRGLPSPAGGPSPLTPLVTADGVRFRHYAPQADSVFVVGGWNGWDPGRQALDGPGPGGIWEAVIPLNAGIWRYAFIVDGQWVEPEGAPRYEEDGFGGRNGVIEVTAGTAPTPVTGSISPRPTGSEEPCP